MRCCAAVKPTRSVAGYRVVVAFTIRVPTPKPAPARSAMPIPATRSAVSASPPICEEIMVTTPTNAVTRPTTPMPAMRSPRNARPKTSTKNGVVFTSTAAFPAPASFVPSAMPSKVSVTMSSPEIAAMASGRPRGRCPRVSTTTPSSTAPAGSARSMEKTTGEACSAPIAVARNAVPQKNTVMTSSRYGSQGPALALRAVTRSASGRTPTRASARSRPPTASGWRRAGPSPTGSPATAPTRRPGRARRRR